MYNILKIFNDIFYLFIFVPLQEYLGSFESMKFWALQLNK